MDPLKNTMIRRSRDLGHLHESRSVIWVFSYSYDRVVGHLITSDPAMVELVTQQAQYELNI